MYYFRPPQGIDLGDRLIRLTKWKPPVGGFGPAGEVCSREELILQTGARGRTCSRRAGN